MTDTSDSIKIDLHKNFPRVNLNTMELHITNEYPFKPDDHYRYSGLPLSKLTVDDLSVFHNINQFFYICSRLRCHWKPESPASEDVCLPELWVEGIQYDTLGDLRAEKGLTEYPR